MQLKPGTFCPLLQKECIQMQCSWFIQVRGKNPNTGQDVDEWGCSMSWLPHLILETASQTRQAGAAIESFRNEMVRANERTVTALLSLPPQNEPKENIKVISYEDNNNQSR